MAVALLHLPPHSGAGDPLLEEAKAGGPSRHRQWLWKFLLQVPGPKLITWLRGAGRVLLAQGGAAGLLGWAALSPCREGNAGKLGAAQQSVGNGVGLKGKLRPLPLMEEVMGSP